MLRGGLFAGRVGSSISGWENRLVASEDGAPIVWPLEQRFAWSISGDVSPTDAKDQPAPQARCLVVVGEELEAGGLAAVAAFLATRLPEHGFATAVMRASPDHNYQMGRIAKDLVRQGVEVVSMGREDSARWILGWGPDVMSVHGGADWCLEIAAELDIPVVETLHGMHTMFDADRESVEHRRELLSGIISVSDLVAQQYLEVDRDCPREMTAVIPNGTDATRLGLVPRAAARAGLGLNDEFLFVSLARHCLQKNNYALAAAFADVAAANPHAHLLISGRPEDELYAAQVETLKSGMTHGDRLHLRDNCLHPGVLLSAADGFVMNSFFEGWSLASMEALVAGTRVIISDVGGAREQLAGDSLRGVLISNPAGDPLDMNWDSIARARFRVQPNRDELVTAMTSMIRSGEWTDEGRQRLGPDATRQFSDATCLRRHATALSAAMRHEDISTALDGATAAGGRVFRNDAAQ